MQETKKNKIIDFVTNVIHVGTQCDLGYRENTDAANTDTYAHTRARAHTHTRRRQMCTMEPHCVSITFVLAFIECVYNAAIFTT